MSIAPNAPNGDGFILDSDGMAVPAADILSDFFAEHSDDQLEGDPADWPDCPWIDDDRYELGPDPDINFLLDQAERRVYERGCNMHFAP